VAPGLLKTSASAGIPGYVDAYLYAEQATLRRQGLSTEEVAAAAAFLLSPRSSGVNAQNIIVDAGMSVNYFDADLVRRALRPEDTRQKRHPQTGARLQPLAPRMLPGSFGAASQLSRQRP